MVNVGFVEGETTVVIDGLTQWDRGRVLQIADDSLPDNYEVHFAPRGCKTAFVVDATAVNGVASVDIPDEALQYGKDVRVYIYVDGKTVKTIVMYVVARAKPEDYVYTPTERLSFASLEKRISTLEAMAQIKLSGEYSLKDDADTSVDMLLLKDGFTVSNNPMYGSYVSNLRIEGGRVVYDCDTSAGAGTGIVTVGLYPETVISNRTITGAAAIWWANNMIAVE